MTKTQRFLSWFLVAGAATLPLSAAKAAEWKPTSDVEFVRRAYLDAIGRLPTPAEVSSFLADRDAKKREKLVDTLLEDPLFADFWALKWADVLRSNRRSIQAKLVQADRLASLGVLSAGVAHEINNPLAYVLLNLEFLEREIERLGVRPEKLESLKGRVHDARHGAERVATIVRDLRTFARGDEGTPGPDGGRAGTPPIDGTVGSTGRPPPRPPPRHGRGVQPCAWCPVPGAGGR